VSLRGFHLLFIALSVILTAFFAAWAVGQYRATPDASYVLAAVVSLAAAVALALYGAAFQRKTKRLS
jgi:membrane protein implicated in regulation of membrane protease activity